MSPPANSVTASLRRVRALRETVRPMRGVNSDLRPSAYFSPRCCGLPIRRQAGALEAWPAARPDSS
jgi:hypothetical protein